MRTDHTTVYNAAGEVELSNGGFAVDGYSDHFVVTHATDEQGNTAADIKRLR